MKPRLGAILLFTLYSVLAACADTPRSPFRLTASMVSSNGGSRITLHFEVPPDHVLYAERLSFQIDDGQALTPVSIADPVLHHDEVSGQEKKVYDHPFSAELQLDSALPLTLIVKIQGCSNSACYFPERHAFAITSGGIAPQSGENPAMDGRAIATPQSASLINTNGLRLVARQTGYVPKKPFLAFLESARHGRAASPDAIAKYNQLGPLVSLLLIVAGGLGLNLTPCVLPLIPINLAIIGAGARASSRRRGFALGAVYGAGMALVYGVLGLLVVLTGSKFGTLNSSLWFNVGIAWCFWSWLWRCLI